MVGTSPWSSILNIAGRWDMMGLDFASRKKAYDYIIVGSGYGGAIFAARLATAKLNPKPSICLLERGREWPVGTFPDQTAGVLAALRDDTNPLGLYEFLNYQDISVIKGSGLGGTSLVNANVAIIPDAEVFAANELASNHYARCPDALLPAGAASARGRPAPSTRWNWPKCRPWNAAPWNSETTLTRSTST